MHLNTVTVSLIYVKHLYYDSGLHADNKTRINTYNLFPLLISRLTTLPQAELKFLLTVFVPLPNKLTSPQTRN
jgi:hypothetical protein